MSLFGHGHAHGSVKKAENPLQEFTYIPSLEEEENTTLTLTSVGDLPPKYTSHCPSVATSEEDQVGVGKVDDLSHTRYFRRTPRKNLLCPPPPAWYRHCQTRSWQTIPNQRQCWETPSITLPTVLQQEPPFPWGRYSLLLYQAQHLLSCCQDPDRIVNEYCGPMSRTPT